MNLQQKFTELLIKIGFPKEEIQKHWEALEKAYSKKSRQYHNLNHLKEMIACYDDYFSKLEFPNEVLYAIFYHDFIYNSSKKDNELKSAEYALQMLPKEITINKDIVFAMILATKDHQCNGVEDEKWLIDFDLRILAKDWDDYVIYFQQIRKEYRIYPDFSIQTRSEKSLRAFPRK